MKKLLSLLLVATLLVGMNAPAMAAESADARLSAVALKVKETLGLDTSTFSSFNGSLYEDALSPVWNLNWSGSIGYLAVETDEDGHVFSYYFYDKSEITSYPGRFSPVFPKGNETAARSAAAAFLDKVLDTSMESVALEADSSRFLGSTQFNYSGTICINGLPSPFTYNISVRAKDNAILRFSRTSPQTKYIGGIPSAAPAATQGAAGSLLKTTLAMRLEYVLSENSKRAVLRYLPEAGDEYYVDAQTGELVNLTECYRTVSDSGDYGLGGKSGSAQTAAEDKPLTDAEQAGIARLEGVLSKEELSRKLQNISALGLGRYTLVSASYSVDEAGGDVACYLQYGRQTDSGLWRRTVTVDAKTGAIRSVFSSAPWNDGESKPEVTVDTAAAQKNAERFLSSYYGEDYVRLSLYKNSGDVSVYSDYSAAYSFYYAQKENGYFYPENYYSVAIDATDGSISSFFFQFDREVTFDSADGIISLDTALDAYFGTYSVQLGYLAVPVKLDPTVPDYIPFIERGYSFLYSLKLAYALARDNYISGIDAKTGKPVVPESVQTKTVSYNDLSGHWAQSAAQRLAQYNVGWLGGSFHPSRQITQFDLVCLLVSTGGYLFDPDSADKTLSDYVYDIAYGMGLLTAAERNDNQTVTRGELVKIILNAGGYGEVANLTGIFCCTFRDESSIPAQYYGYAALAQGFGIVGGDSEGNFACSRTATRAEAAVMLSHFMSR